MDKLAEIQKRLCRFHRAPEFNRDCSCSAMAEAFAAGVREASRVLAAHSTELAERDPRWIREWAEQPGNPILDIVPEKP